MKYVIEERFVVALEDPGEASGKTTRHIVEAASASEAIADRAREIGARLLGVTERPDGSVAATMWRQERLYRLHASVAPED